MAIYQPNRNIVVLFLTFVIGLSLALVLPWLADLQAEAAQSRTSPGYDAAPEAGAVYHVSKTGDGSTGLDWKTAFTNPQSALNIAISGDEIWVATGVYTPGINEEDSFVLVSGVAMYGGFAGSESLKSERDWETNPTILSGDIEGDDTNVNGVVRSYTHIVDNNSTHVISATGVADDTLLDGFTITAGKADGSYPESAGGGFYCDGSGGGNVCSLTLRNMIFSGNFGDNYAGAMFNDGGEGGNSSPNYINVIFTGNWSYEGGAIYNYASQGGDCSPYMRDVIFISNSADEGGAIFNSSALPSIINYHLVNVLFSGNWAQSDGGAIYHEQNSYPEYTNVTISGNRSQGNGGGIYNRKSSTHLRNTILWNNQDDSGTGTISSTIFVDSGLVTITHSLVQGAGPSGAGWISDPNYIDGGGNIDLDPLFETPVNPATAPSNTGDMHLQENSPARDAGDNMYVTLPTDLVGSPRIVNFIVDMGAYEFQLQYPFDGYLPVIVR